MTSPPSHAGFGHNREMWDWASREAHRLWITGSDSPDHYDRSGWHDALKLVAACPGHRDEVVLEWGCGSGRVTQYLCHLFRRVEAVDIAPGMLALLGERRLPGTTAHLTSGGDLPDGLDVDVIYSYLCWMHNRKADLFPILRACRRALRTGGRVVFQLPVYETPRDPEGFVDLACWTAAEMDDLAARTGFEVTRVRADPGTFSFENVGPNHFELHEFRAGAGAPGAGPP